MATLKQTIAIMKIYQRLGKTISFDKASKWRKEDASRFIGKHYVSYYDVIREIQEKRRNHD
ncbi:MAG: hypothetical protein UY16_C0007G0012 [Candidatus Gottesmanbacteria bacterium GW2011_GWA2_47_9]|uniref:Uncharacterized protein n=1 Tax=Candidatus Gottesmanbacteria bacterium GW2011_GWA2_47_9 TaxID=1618445 RepID=A0A0G1U2Y2_9BACT|nr:MAG: hypothetical protein UY16_C0007G0012 [Candidatus Gottesmanbacteria bacterium GW2011_GWA2_47_9]